MVKDKPYDRAVAVTITGPDVSKYKQGSKEVDALAQQAWRSIHKKITIGGVTVKVEGYGR